MTLHIAGFAGSQSQTSKTRALVDFAGQRGASQLGAAYSGFDLRDLQPSLGAAARLEDLTPNALAAVQSLVAADALILASPVYKGSYAGLFKHLFDLIDPAALQAKPILLLATGGGDRHALVIEHQLRPLFAFFEAAVMPTGVYAAAADFGQAGLAPRLVERLDRGLAQLAQALGQQGLSKAAA